MKIFASPSAETFLSALAIRLLHTNNELLVCAALPYIPLETLLVTSVSFGLSSRTLELINEKIASFDDLKITMAISGLTEEQRVGLRDRFARFLGIEEEEMRQEKQQEHEIVEVFSN